MLGAQALGGRVRLRGGLGMEHELDEPGAVAQVDEDQPAVVAPAVHPAGDAHGLADARGGELAAPGVAVAVRPRRPHSESLRDVVHDRAGLHCLLLSRLHVLQRGALVAEDGNVAGAGAVRLLELALERAPAEFESRRVPRAARVGGEPERGLAQLRLRVRDEQVERRRGLVRQRARQQDPLDARRPAHARRRRAADLLDQPVVAPAAADARLRAEVGGRELEHGARVVVQAAHERRCRPRTADRPRRAGRARRRSARSPRGRARRAAAARRAITARVPGWSESNARSGFRSIRATTSSDSRAALLAQVLLQLVAVAQAVERHAEARDPQPRPHAGGLEDLGEQQDRLGVDGRVVGADRLGADLPELAEAPLLRALAAEEARRSTRASPAAAACACRAPCRRGTRARCPRAAA